MSVMQILQEVRELHRAVQEQLNLIEDFRRTNKDNISLVRAELQGSTKGHDSLMLGSLDQVESSLSKSSAALQQAEKALLRVQAV